MDSDTTSRQGSPNLDDTGNRQPQEEKPLFMSGMTLEERRDALAANPGRIRGTNKFPENDPPPIEPPQKTIMFPADERARKQYRADLDAWQKRQHAKRLIVENDERLGITERPFTPEWYAAHEKAKENPSAEQQQAIAAYQGRMRAGKRAFRLLRLVGCIVAFAFCVQGYFLYEASNTASKEKQAYVDSHSGTLSNTAEYARLKGRYESDIYGLVLSIAAAVGLVLLWVYPLTLVTLACFAGSGLAIWRSLDPNRYAVAWPIVGLVFIEGIVLLFFARLAYAYRNPHRISR